MIIAWSDLVQRLTDKEAECLWQDLDGLHVEVAPAAAPCTSIIWAWTLAGAGGPLWRIRLDGTTCYVAEHDPQGLPGQRLAPWGENQQIAQARARVHARRGVASTSNPPDPATITLYQVVPPMFEKNPVPFFYRIAP